MAITTTATITPESTVGTLASEHPSATRVFARHGIDFCCGGGRSLAAICGERGLDPAVLVAEIEAEIETSAETPELWVDAPLEGLIDHIIATYHRPLAVELPRLQEMAEKVHRVHGDKDPERLAGVLSTFRALRAELEDHMTKEEMILFPMIRQGRGYSADGPISVMEHEHESAGEALATLRRLTDDYQAPEAACTTWRALWHGLEVLEREMHQHIHLENNILFPRALRGE